MADQNIILGYWGFRGLGQIPRLLLHYTNTPYQNKIYSSFEEWFAGDKKTLGLDFPNLPYLIDADFRITQSKAIITYIIRKSKHDELLGKNLHDQALVLEVGGVLGDLFDEFRTALLSEDLVTAKNKVFQEKTKTKLDNLTKFLGDKEWFVGYLTVADFSLAEIWNHIDGMFPEQSKAYGTLKALHQRFEALPQIKSYYASEAAIKSPFLPPHMKWG